MPIGSDLFSGLKQLDEAQVQMTAIREIRYSFLFGSINFDGDRYAARLPENDDHEYQIALVRRDHTDAPRSSVILPADFSLFAPLAGDSYSRGNAHIQIDWAPVEPDVTVKVEITTSCLDDAYDSYVEIIGADTGSHTVEAGTLTANGNCTSNVSLVKSRLGNFDSAFTGGRVAGHQVRSVAINTTE